MEHDFWQESARCQTAGVEGAQVEVQPSLHRQVCRSVEFATGCVFHALCSFRKVEGYGGNKPSPSWVWPVGAEVHMQRKGLAVERTSNFL